MCMCMFVCVFISVCMLTNCGEKADSEDELMLQLCNNLTSTPIMPIVPKGWGEKADSEAELMLQLGNNLTSTPIMPIVPKGCGEEAVMLHT